MGIGLPISVARRYLMSKKAHSAVNLISIVAVSGIVVTTVAIVCVLSVFNGFAGLIDSRLSKIDPDLSISPVRGKVIPHADSISTSLWSEEGVEMALPTLTDNALAVCDNRQMPIKLKGVPNSYDRLTDIGSLVKEDGEYMIRNEGWQYAVISVGVAIELRTYPWSKPMQLYAPQRQGRINVANPMSAFRADSVVVSGVFQVDQKEYDADVVIVPIEMARRLLDYTDEASAIEVKVTEGYDADKLMRRLQQRLGSDYKVKNRLMQAAYSYRMVNVEKWVTFLLLAFILLIAAFNVVSTIAVMIVEKRRDIATMRNMGASHGFVTSIFRAQAWIINIVGGLIGMALGVALCMAQKYFGLIRFNADSDMLIVDTYPVEVVWSDMAVVAVLLAAVSLLASLIVTLIMRRR